MSSGPRGGAVEPSADWARRLRALVGTARAEELSQFVPVGGERRAAVLMLFGAGVADAGEVVLLERAPTLRAHAGQVSFPGGSIDPGETPVEAAVREAWEETGLDAASIDVWGELPSVGLPVTNFAVDPVVAWWRDPHELAADQNESRRVVRVPLPELVDPAHRFTTQLRFGGLGPGFVAQDLFIWGFTANLLSRVLALTGLAVPWDESVLREVPAHQLRR